MPAFGLIASEDVLKTKGGTIRKFLAVSARAWKQAWAGTGAEMVEAMARARPQGKVNQPIEVARVGTYKRLAVVDEVKGKSVFWQSPATWDKFFKVMIESGVLPAGSKPEEYYTNSYLPAQ